MTRQISPTFVDCIFEIMCNTVRYLIISELRAWRIARDRSGRVHTAGGGAAARSREGRERFTRVRFTRHEQSSADGAAHRRQEGRRQGSRSTASERTRSVYQRRHHSGTCK